MADPTMDQTDDMSADAPQSDDSGADQGFCIEIRCSSDGSIKVGVESLADEQSEEAGGGESAEGDDNEQYQEVGSFAEAMKLAKEIYTHAGSMQDMTASQSEMDSGYGKAGA